MIPVSGSRYEPRGQTEVISTQWIELPSAY